MTAAIDTAAGAVLVAEDRMPLGAEIRPMDDITTVLDASGRKLNISGSTWMDVEIGGLSATIHAWIVPKLLVPLILGTPFINRYVEAIIPANGVLR